MQIKIGNKKEKHIRINSDDITQGDYSLSITNRFSNSDINIFKEFLPQFKSQKLEDRISQIEEWEKKRRINAQTKEQFISLVEILAQSDKAKDEEIAKLQQQGNIIEADIKQHLKDSFQELKLEKLNKVRDEELERNILKTQTRENNLLKAKIYSEVGDKTATIFAIKE